MYDFERNKRHSFVFADLRRLAAKKAPASSRKSFSFFKRRISFSCSLTRWRSFKSSSLSDIVLCGVCEPSPGSRLSGRSARTRPYMVFWSPQFFGGFRLSDFLCGFHCLYFIFMVVLPVFCHFSSLLILLIISQILENGLSTFLCHIRIAEMILVSTGVYLILRLI